MSARKNIWMWQNQQCNRELNNCGENMGRNIGMLGHLKLIKIYKRQDKNKITSLFIFCALKEIVTKLGNGFRLDLSRIKCKD